jgi:DoxX-like protein
MHARLPGAAALALIRQVCRFTVAGIWFYQALAPKLLGPHADELALAAAFGIPAGSRVAASYGAGVAELAVGALVVIFHRHTWPQVLSASGTALLLAFVVLYAPAYLTAAFNPVVMNCASIALSAIAVVALRAADGSGTE